MANRFLANIKRTKGTLALINISAKKLCLLGEGWINLKASHIYY